MVLQKTPGPVDLRDFSNWWDWKPGAYWRHPEGKGSSVAKQLDHPVVHVAFEDTEAYAYWAGKALPTEAEWELAARGGLDGTEFAWGDEFAPGGRQMANSWQGEFPWQNLCAYGFRENLTGWRISAKRLRPVRYGWQCLGVDDRLVHRSPSDKPQEPLLRTEQPTGRAGGGQF